MRQPSGTHSNRFAALRLKASPQRQLRASEHLKCIPNDLTQPWQIVRGLLLVIGHTGGLAALLCHWELPGTCEWSRASVWDVHCLRCGYYTFGITRKKSQEQVDSSFSHVSREEWTQCVPSAPAAVSAPSGAPLSSLWDPVDNTGPEPAELAIWNRKFHI